MSDESTSPQAEVLDLARFLESIPPNVRKQVSIQKEHDGGGSQRLVLPDLLLHCDEDLCKGERYFRGVSGAPYVYEKASLDRVIFEYECRNCQTGKKWFALVIFSAKQGRVATKLGEAPAFGPPTPSRLIALVGTDRDLYLRGRRAEIAGLGIGAFAYYRRVVENQHARFLDEIIRVARKCNAAPAAIAQLEAAREETQFSKSVDLMRDAVPDRLRIDGHNPLTLLHGALSEGLHSLAEDDCMELAQVIRVVLTELSERIGEALKDHNELRAAMTRLHTRQQPDKA